MLDQFLIEFANENNFKVTNNAIFGVYKHILVKLSLTTHAQVMVIITLDRDKKVSEALSEKENQKQIKKISKSLLQINEDSIILTNANIGIRRKIKKEKLTKLLNELEIFLEEYQDFSNVQTANLILINDIPTLNSEEIIHQMRNQVHLDNQKIIFNDKGFLASTMLTNLAGCVLGLLTGLANAKYNTNINFLAKSVIITSIAVGIYKKFSRGIDNTSKLLIGISATSGFILWEICRNATILKLDEKQLNIEMLFDLFEKNINTGTPTGRFNLLSLIIIWAISCFIKKTNNKKINFEEGSFLDDKKLKEFELIRKGNILSSVVLVLAFISLFVFGLLQTSIHEDFNYFSYIPFLYIGILSYGVIWFLLEKLKRFSPSFEHGVTHIGYTKISKPLQVLLNQGIIGLLVLSNCIFISWVNIYFDNSKTQKLNAKLLENYSHKNKCERLKFTPNKMDRLSMRICKSDYAFLNEDIEAIINYKQGVLDLPYAISVSFPQLDSFEMFLSYLQRPLKDLRNYQIAHFYKKDKSEFFKEKIRSWKTLCNTGSGEHCRLTAYIETAKGDLPQANSYFQKGCNKNDPTACYSLILSKEINKPEKLPIMNKLEMFCNLGDGQACYYSAVGYHVLDGEQASEKIESFMKKACSLSFKSAYNYKYKKKGV